MFYDFVPFTLAGIQFTDVMEEAHPPAILFLDV
jgi:hypothetical protein